MRVPRKRLNFIAETQMISLADIAFLIIFFFLITSSLLSEKQEVPLPVLAKTQETTSSLVVVMDKDAKIYLNGQAVGSADALERELKGAIADKTASKDVEVRLRCDKRLKYSECRGVFEAISHAGGVIAIMHDLPR